MLSPFFDALVVDFVNEFIREGVLSELLYADDLVLLSEVVEGLMNKFWKWKKNSEINGLRDSIGKTYLMVSIGNREDWLSTSKLYSCGICCLSLKVNSVLCAVW